MGVFADVSRDVLWMSPVSNLVWYGLAWAVLAVVARLVAGERGFAVGVWGLIATFTFSLFLPFTAIHRIAALIFAAGLATALVRVHRRSPQSWLRRARMTRNVLAVGFLGANIVMVAGSSLAARRAARHLPDARADSLNVIFLVIDTMRGDVLQSADTIGASCPFWIRWPPGRSTSICVCHDVVDAAVAWLDVHRQVRGSPEYHHDFTARWRVSYGRRSLRGEVGSTLLDSRRTFTTSWESGLNRGFHEWRDYQRSFRQVLRSSVIGQLQMFIEISDATSWQDVVAALRRHQIMVYPKPEQHAPTATEMTDRFLSSYNRKPARPFSLSSTTSTRITRTVHLEPTARGSHPILNGVTCTTVSSYVDDELRRLFSELRQRAGLEIRMS
jgi:hypothetical protein